MKYWKDRIKSTDPLPIRRYNDYVKCENCGYTLPMQDKEKGLCKYCGKYIFKNKKDEFNYRLKERLK